MGKTKTQELRESSKLESEISKLKKTVARLRKKLERYESVIPDEDEEPVQIGVFIKEKCPGCSNKDVVEFDIAGRLYKLCKTCKWRKRI
jgi:ribosomal protein S27E